MTTIMADQSARLFAQEQDGVVEAIEQWLGEKYGLTESRCTEIAYRDILLALRSYLQENGLDLDAGSPDLPALIQTWAGLRTSGSRREGTVAPSTYNQRIAAVSSFYRWLIEQGRYPYHNPVDQLARASVQKYAQARALNPQQVRLKLSAIDRSTVRGLRDYMLLQVALNTGRSTRELASLSWGHVTLQETSVVLMFERCKGGKTMYHSLEPQLSQALLAYLRSVYGTELETLPPETPLWMSFSDRSYGQAIGPQTIADICETHLGVSSVHTLRHTFALTMDQLGAETDTIQSQLGHERRATTTCYLDRLKQAHNPYASALASVFGVEEVQSVPR